MVKVYCQNLNPVCWAWVTEYARRRRIKRCEALEKIIEQHIKFTMLAHEEKIGVRDSGKKKKKQR